MIWNQYDIILSSSCFPLRCFQSDNLHSHLCRDPAPSGAAVDVLQPIASSPKSDNKSFTSEHLYLLVYACSGWFMLFFPEI